MRSSEGPNASLLTSRWLDPPIALFILFLIGVYIAAIGPYWNISPDSATYVANARAIAGGQPLPGDLRWSPLTSFVLAPVAALGSGYRALNAFTTLLVLGSLWFAFRLIAGKRGRTHALIVTLFALGSVRVFHESVQLLSEPLYMLLSFAALLLLETDRENERGRAAVLVGGLALILAALTRTIGITLVAAVLLHELLAWWRKRPVRWLAVGAALTALAGIVVWEVSIVAGGGTSNYLGVLLENPWASEGSPIAGPAALVAAARHNVDRLPSIGAMLGNALWPGRVGGTVLALQGIGVVVFLVGLIGRLRRRTSLTALYTCLYVIAVMYHVINNGDGTYRYLVPVVPLIFHYALSAVRTCVSTRRSPWLRATVAGLVGVYSIWFLSHGVRENLDGVREQHRSPFPDYYIKRQSNYDLQRVSMWLADNAGPDEVFASTQPDMIEILAEREGVDLAGLTGDPSRLLEWLAANHVAWVIFDRASDIAETVLPPALSAHSDRFEIVEDLPRAALFRVRS